MPPFYVLIDGVDRSAMTRAVGSLRIEYQLGARARADLEILDRDSFQTAYRPALDQRLSVRTATPAGPRVFDGLIFNVEDGPLGPPGVGTVTSLQAVDDWKAAGQRRVSYTYPTGMTLKQVVEHLVLNWLAVFNISLDPTMPDGPVLGEVTFDAATLEEAFTRLATLTGWVYRLRPDNVVEWFVIGTKVRAFTLSTANKNILGPVRWTKTRGQYVNKVILRYGTGLVGRVDSWVGNGTQIRFPLAYPLAVAGWVTYIGGPYPPPGGHEGVGATAAVGYPWWYDGATNELVRNIGAPIPGPATAQPPAPGDQVSLEYSVQYPLTVTAETAEATTNPYETVVEAADIFETAQAQTLADSLRRKYGPLPRTVTLRTRAASDILPGDTVAVNLPERTLPNALYLVTSVAMGPDEDQQLTSTLNLLEGNEAQASWIDFWREALGSGSSSGVGIVSGSVIPSPAPGGGGGGGGDLTGIGEASELATWTAPKTLGQSGIRAVNGALIGGATGAGFTIALGTSTITGVLPAANLPPTIAYTDRANVFTVGPQVMHADSTANALNIIGRQSDTVGYINFKTFAGQVEGFVGASTSGMDVRSATWLYLGNTTANGGIFLNPLYPYVLPSPSYKVQLGREDYKFLTLHAAELWVETLVAQNTLATIGGRILVGPTTVLTRDLLASTGTPTTIYVKHNFFKLFVSGVTYGSTLVLESGGKFEILLVDSQTTPPAEPDGSYAYVVHRNRDGSGQNDWYAGDAVFDTGIGGDGFLDMYSVRGISIGVGPTIVGNVRTSWTPWNDWTPRWAIGNLDGLYNYTGTTYGAAFGDASKTHLTIDSTYGLRIRYGAADRLVADTNGNLSLIGTLTVGAGGSFSAGTVLLDSNGVSIALPGTSSASYAYDWRAPDSYSVGLYASDSPPTERNITLLNHTSTSSNARIRFEAYSNSGVFTIMKVETRGSQRYIELYAEQGQIYLKGGVGGNVTIESPNIYLDATGGYVRTTGYSSIPTYDNGCGLGLNTNRWQAVWAVNGTIQTSDATAKTEIRDNPLGLAFLERLPVKSFQYRDDPTPGRIGFLTQDVKAALEGQPFAALVHVAEGGPSGLHYAGFVPVLTQAVQELAARLRTLEARS
jgi:hypothetical protein